MKEVLKRINLGLRWRGIRIYSWVKESNSYRMHCSKWDIWKESRNCETPPPMIRSLPIHSSHLDSEESRTTLSTPQQRVIIIVLGTKTREDRNQVNGFTGIRTWNNSMISWIISERTSLKRMSVESVRKVQYNYHGRKIDRSKKLGAMRTN